jgi:hypothetical protein
MKRALKWIGPTAGVLVLLGVLGFLGLAHIKKTVKQALEPTVAVEKYGQILTDWKATGLVDHFPDSIPLQARNVHFSSFPGFLQGGAHVQLRIELPASEVKKLYDQATNLAKQYHDGGNSTTLINERADGLYSTIPHTLVSGKYVFSEDYRVFIYDANPYQKGSGHDWNHGKSKGVVISLQRNEVIYYAENW